MSIHALRLGSELVRRSFTNGKIVTNLSIQKLAYFCHGWHLALLEEPLVDEQFEAWKLGPVLPTLYHTYKVFSSNPIPPQHPIVSTQQILDADSNTSRLIDKVLEVYGKYSPAQLVDLSHDRTGPWEKVWSNDLSDGVIPNDSIKSYFDSLAKRN